MGFWSHIGKMYLSAIAAVGEVILDVTFVGPALAMALDDSRFLIPMNSMIWEK